jgi:hypothetical protein
MNLNWKLRGALGAILFLAFCVPASAQTLYKLIDKNGKVTYSETAPKSFDGQVIRIDIDPNANTMIAPKAPAATDASRATPQKPAEVKARTGSDAQGAKERLEAAKKALAEARDNPAEGEVTRVGNVGGGTRPVFSEEYQRRVARLELEVKSAEEELKRAEGR